MAAPAEIPHEQVGEQEATGSCRCGPARRPSGRTSRSARHRHGAAPSGSSLAGQRVVEPDLLTGPPRWWPAPASRSTGPRLPSTVEVAGRCLHADAPPASMPSRSAIAARIASRSAARRGPRGDDRHIHRRRSPAGTPPVASTTAAQQVAAGDPRVAGPAGNMPTEVAETGRPEQRVGEACSDDVAIGVTVEPRRASDLDAAEPQRLARAERMRSRPSPDRRIGLGSTEQRGRPLQIGGDRHLEVGGIAGDDMDGNSTGLQQGGLVGPGPVRGDIAGQRAAKESSGGRPAASARRPGRTDRRSPSIRSSTTRLSVSLTGTTGIAAPCRSVAATTSATERRPGTNGRAPSWTRTTRARRDPGRFQAPEPGADRILAPSPPSTNVDPIAPEPSAPPSSASPPLGGRDDHDRPDGRGRASASTACASSGRSPIIASELVRAAHPRRGAGGDDDRVGEAPAPVLPDASAMSLSRGAAARRSSDRPRSGGPA